MLRRSLSLLLIIGFVANQWAAIPHAHADGNAAEHNQGPHFHWSWICHDHCHRHGDRQHHHGQPLVPVDTVGADGEHDSDAIYVTSNAAPGGDCRNDSRAKVVAVALPDLAAPTPIDLADRPTSATVGLLHTRAPDCALYLTLRALRI